MSTEAGVQTKAADTIAESGRLRGKLAKAITLLLVAAMPKCPLCVLAMLGMWGSVEAGSWAVRAARWPWLPVVALTALAAIVIGLWRRHGARTAVVAGLGAAALWTAKFVWDSTTLLGAGAALLSVALVFGPRLRRKTVAAGPGSSTVALGAGGGCCQSSAPAAADAGPAVVG